MGSGADAGNKTATRKPGPPGTANGRSSAARWAQQCGDNGHSSAPQELLRLVGCRETKAAPGSKRRRDPSPVQR